MVLRRKEEQMKNKKFHSRLSRISVAVRVPLPFQPWILIVDLQELAYRLTLNK